MSTTNFWSEAHKLTGRAIVAEAVQIQDIGNASNSSPSLEPARIYIVSARHLHLHSQLPIELDRRLFLFGTCDPENKINGFALVNKIFQIKCMTINVVWKFGWLNEATFQFLLKFFI